jgi:xylulokinase
LIDNVEANAKDDHTPIFLPYLSGERTPHNDPHAKGAFFGMTHETGDAELGLAVLEGVAFAFADGQQSLIDAGTEIGDVTVIGGGSRSGYWAELMADVLQRPLILREGGEVGPAYGAARLGRVAAESANPVDVCTAPPVNQVVEPDPKNADRLAERLERYRKLYAQTRELMS